MSNRHYTQTDVSHNRWYELTVNVAFKINRGSFGIKHDRHGEFTFCAQSPADARAIAGHHVKGAKCSIDTTRMVEIVDFMAISREALPLVHAPLKSLSEVASELEEMEYA
jgi:hypothetical protein